MNNGKPYRKVQCIDRINGARFYVYDANNNLESVTDAENNTTTQGVRPRYVFTKDDNKTRTVPR